MNMQPVVTLRDDYTGMSKEMFNKMPPRELDLIDSVLITKSRILDRCDQLANQVFNDYIGENLHIYVIGKASAPFFNDFLASF